MFNVKTMFVKRNLFNLSHTRAFDGDMGNLYPILCEETLPGDTFSVKTDMLVRLAPMVAPMMHEVNVFTRFFFVPNRLIWTDWEKFITGGADGKDASVWPHFHAFPVQQGTLADYFGLPVTNPHTLDCSSLPFRAYAKIYNDWFLNQTLQTPITFSMASGVDATTPNGILTVNWEKDYFTSCMPDTQRGDPVVLPLGTTAPVTVTTGTPTSATVVNRIELGAAGSANPNRILGLQGDDATMGPTDLHGTADLATATAAEVNDVRLAFSLQRVMEKLMRTGARYVEYIMAMFGVRSSDARLQRAEYLGGGKSQVIVSEVLQTSETGTTPQGNMAGHGFSAHQSHEFKKSFEEHGYIIGLLYILPRTAYQQGLPRTFTRSSRWDYYVPFLAHLGEQAVLKKEIYCDSSDGHDDEVFGYQGRFDEYRRRESSVHNDFRNPTGLGTWHLGRIFASRPGLDDSFTLADPAKRPFATTSYNTCWIYLKNHVKAIRPLPKIGEPGFIDH